MTTYKADPDKETVLIVDDTPQNLAMLSRILTQGGYGVRSVNSGVEALSIVRTELPDLILLDVRMPEMDGYEVCRRLKMDEQTRDIPVIFLSVMGNAWNRVKGFKVGGADYITKPFEVQEILARLETHLALRRTQRELQTTNRELKRHLQELTSSQEALAQEQELLRTLMGNIPDYIYFKDKTSRFLRINEALAAAFDLDEPAQAVGKTDFDFFGREHASQTYLDEQQIIATGQPLIGIEEKEGWPDGRESWVSTTKVPLHDEIGRIVGVFGISRDITQAKWDEEKLRQRTAQLEALRAVGLELAAQLDLESLVHSIVYRSAEMVGGDGGGLWLYRPERDSLELTASTGGDPVPVGALIRRGEGVVGRVWLTGQPLLVSDYRQWPDRIKRYEDTSMVTVVGVPLRWNKELLGVLSIHFTKASALPPADFELLTLLAIQMAIAIQNARLYDRARQDADTKATLLREVNHRVQNNLMAIIGLLRLEANRVELDNHSSYRVLVSNLNNRLQGLAAVHRLLSAAKWAPLPLNKLAEQVIESALQALSWDRWVTVIVSPSSVRIVPQQTSDLALVINELVTNSVKHAWTGRQAGRIEVRISLEERPASASRVVFEFRDDGVGYPKEVLRLESHNVGWELVKSLVIRGLRGEVHLHNDQGAVATIRFPWLSD